MSWYLKTIESQSAEQFQQWGVPQESQDYINSVQDKKIKGSLVNYVRQNPNATLQELQNIGQSATEQKDISPYLDIEEDFVRGFNSPEAQKWALVSLRKARKGRIRPGSENWPGGPEKPEDDPEYDRTWRYLDLLYRGNRLNDYLRANPNANLGHLTPEQAFDVVQDWEDTVAGQGSGKMYEPTNPDLIQYGPDWENPEWSGWTIQEVRSENDLKVEGNKMGHCVGSYCEQVEAGDARIFSLRDPKNVPHVTLEADPSGWHFKQIEGNGPKTGNAEPGQEYKDMIREWSEHLEDKGENPTSSVSNDTNTSLIMLGINNAELDSIREVLKDTMSWYNDDDEFGKNEYGMEDLNTNSKINNLDLSYIYNETAKRMAEEINSNNYENIDGIGEVMLREAISLDITAANKNNFEKEKLLDSVTKQMAQKKYRNKYFNVYSTEGVDGALEYFKNYFSEDKTALDSLQRSYDEHQRRQLGAKKPSQINYSMPFDVVEKYIRNEQNKIIEQYKTYDSELSKEIDTKILHNFKATTYVDELMWIVYKERNSNKQKNFFTEDSQEELNDQILKELNDLKKGYMSRMYPNTENLEWVKETVDENNLLSSMEEVTEWYYLLKSQDGETTANTKNWYKSSFYNQKSVQVKTSDDQTFDAYHGSPNADSIKEQGFLYKYLGTGHDGYGPGFYFADAEEVASPHIGEGDGSGIVRATININKPVMIQGNHSGPPFDQYPAIGSYKDTKDMIMKSIELFGDEKLYDYGDVEFEGREKVVDNAVRLYQPLPFIYIINDFYPTNIETGLRLIQQKTGHDGAVVDFNDGHRYIIAWFREQININEVIKS